MKKSELRQLIREEIQKLDPKNIKSVTLLRSTGGHPLYTKINGEKISDKKTAHKFIEKLVGKELPYMYMSHDDVAYEINDILRKKGIDVFIDEK